MTSQRRLGLRSATETAEAVTGEAVVAPFTERRANLAVYQALANSPRLLNAWLPLCDYFLETPGLDPRDREALILRTAQACGSVYEWEKHAPKAGEVGLAAADLEALAGRTRADHDPWLSTLIAFVDELHETSAVSDATWGDLVARVGEEMALTCLMLVGQYHMLAFTLNGARITKDADPDQEREGPR